VDIMQAKYINKMSSYVLSMYKIETGRLTRNYLN